MIFGRFQLFATINSTWCGIVGQINSTRFFADTPRTIYVRGHVRLSLNHTLGWTWLVRVFTNMGRFFQDATFCPGYSFPCDKIITLFVMQSIHINNIFCYLSAPHSLLRITNLVILLFWILCSRAESELVDITSNYLGLFIRILL